MGKGLHTFIKEAKHFERDVLDILRDVVNLPIIHDFWLWVDPLHTYTDNGRSVFPCTITFSTWEARSDGLESVFALCAHISNPAAIPAHIQDAVTYKNGILEYLKKTNQNMYQTLLERHGYLLIQCKDGVRYETYLQTADLALNYKFD